jgi:hypothetical protein
MPNTTDETITEKKSEKAPADALTVAKVSGKRNKRLDGMPKVKVTLPLPAFSDTVNEQIECVTHKGYKYQIRCGFPVEIPVPVFMILKQGKYKDQVI